MANRYTTQFVSALEKRVVTLYANVTFGASGAPTLNYGSKYNSKGIVSITQNGTGDYTFVFGSTGQSVIKDVYFNLLDVSVVFTAGASAPAAPIISIETNSTATVGSSSLRILLWDYAGVAANPANTEGGRFTFVFSDCSAP